jgi:Cytochrome P460
MQRTAVRAAEQRATFRLQPRKPAREEYVTVRRGVRPLHALIEETFMNKPLTVSVCACLLWAACGDDENDFTPFDAGRSGDAQVATSTDAGRSDAGTPTPDGGRADGGAAPDIDGGSKGDAGAGDAGASDAGAGDAGARDAGPLDAGQETIPTNAAALEAWLADGGYKGWKAEPSVHAARPPSPHGRNRVYTNALISDNVNGTAPWPVGAAAVKELYVADGGTAIIGYAVEVKQQASSDGGVGWYWYRRQPSADGGVSVAEGTPAGCIGCHANAGGDGGTPHARDFVFTPVP